MPYSIRWFKFLTTNFIDLNIKSNITIILFKLKNEIFHPKSEDGVPHCESSGCGGVVRPDVVLFGEALPEGKNMYQLILIQVAFSCQMPPTAFA